MKTKIFRIILLTMLFFSLASSPAAQATAPLPSGRYEAQELIISLKPGVAASLDVRSLSAANLGTPALSRMARQFGVHAVQPVFESISRSDPLAAKYNLGGVLLLKVGPGTDLRAMRDAFRANPAIEYAELNIKVYASILPNDPKFEKQWSLHNADDRDIDAPTAWNISRGTPGIRIAVIDTGVLYTHPDLRHARILTDIDKDFANNDDDALDDHGHGTHVTGIIAAQADNEKGIAGICWDCSILPIKVLGADGSGNAAGLAKAIEYAANKNARIISMSLGIDPACGCSKTIAQAINYAYEKGSLLIAASGNDGKSSISYPASSPRVMAIGATNRNDARAYWSNYGKDLDLVAPGDKILSLGLDNTYVAMSGTSMAAPHASGVAGLIWSLDTALTNAQMWWALRHAVDDLRAEGRDLYTGFGRLNAYKGVTRDVVGTVEAPVDTCDKEPEEGCGSCSTQVALGSDPLAKQDLAVLYKFRDNVLSQSERGREWTALFYRHTFEVSELLASDDQLRLQASAVLRGAMPAIRLLVAGGAGEQVTITSEQIDAIRAFKDALANKGSTQLKHDLESQWNALAPERFAGMDAMSIWAEITR